MKPYLKKLRNEINLVMVTDEIEIYGYADTITIPFLVWLQEFQKTHNIHSVINLSKNLSHGIDISLIVSDK